MLKPSTHCDWKIQDVPMWTFTNKWERCGKMLVAACDLGRKNVFFTRVIASVLVFFQGRLHSLLFIVGQENIVTHFPMFYTSLELLVLLFV